MKFIVAVDMEGIACAYAPLGGKVDGSFNIAAVRRQATREANAAATALFACGASEVIVWDNHSSGCNLDYDELDERCKIALGASTGTRYPVIDPSYAGVLFVGYHAMEGTPGAVIAHTYSSVRYQHLRINGVDHGEMGIDAAVAGENGVPVIFVSSDDKGCCEAKQMLPWVETVETKQSFSFTRTLSKHPKAVEKEIFAAVKKAVSRLDEMQLYTFPSPFELEVRFKRLDEAQHARIVDMNGDMFVFGDAFTRKGTLKTADDIFFRL